MNTLRIAIALGFLAVPAFAQTGFDLPHLTWPTETVSPTTMGCADPTQIGTATACPAN